VGVEYSVFMRGKRSVELDLRKTADRDAVTLLLETADVLLDDDGPDEFLGSAVGIGEVAERFPALVRCSFSSFGHGSDLNRLPAYEPLVHAAAGTNYEQIGHRDGPIFEGVAFASLGAAYLGVIGSLASLYRRAQDGSGRRVETSLFDGAHAYLTMLYSMQWGSAAMARAHSEMDLHSQIPTGTRLVTGSYRCEDGEWIGVHTGAVGAFGRLMKLVGLDDRVPPSESGLDMGIPLSPEERLVLEELHGIFASAPRDVWVQRLVGADVCGIPVLYPGQIFDEPQVRHNRMTVTVEDPILGTLEQVAPAIDFSVTKSSPGTSTPRVGQHTAAVLADITSHGSAWPGQRVFLGQHTPVSDSPPLTGVKIVDLGAYYAGPYASRLLADMGADVVKLEPVRGDQFRGTLMFRAAQAGKRSLALDLRREHARSVAYSLLARADIVCHNMRPGAAERLGVDYEQVQEINPNVIYGHAVGWGTDGPNAAWQSFEPMMSGYVGVEFEVAGRYNSPLYPAGNADPGNGLLGAVAMLMALLHREQAGVGQHFVNAQLNATMLHLAHVTRDSQGNVIGAGQLDPMQFGVASLERIYMTADGWVCIAVRTADEYDALVKSLALDAVPAFEDTVAGTDIDERLGIAVEAAMAPLKTTEVLRRLTEAGVPALEPQRYDNGEFMNDPINRSLGRVVQFEHPTEGTRRELNRLIRLSGATLPPYRCAPALGEHTKEILASVGCPDDVIEWLAHEGMAKLG
jgi:crotonobetainyl-CoA:carnitine CoA-transferase CaiB-like acyl-CoA transferase